MGILMGVQFLAVLVAAIAWCQPGAKAVRCDDVTRLDFKNLVVRTAGFSFAFHNGFALNSDDPLAEKVDEEKPDWKAEIETDKVIRPAPGVVVRLLVIHDVHQTGSGRRYYATGLRCVAGKLEEVFQRSGASLGIDRLDAKEIGIGLNVTPGKPVRKHWTYVWNPATARYAISATYSTLK